MFALFIGLCYSVHLCFLGDKWLAFLSPTVVLTVLCVYTVCNVNIVHLIVVNSCWFKIQITL